MYITKQKPRSLKIPFDSRLVDEGLWKRNPKDKYYIERFGPIYPKEFERPERIYSQ